MRQQPAIEVAHVSQFIRSAPGVLPFPRPRPPTTLPEDSMNATDLCYTPATELLALIRKKVVSPVEICQAFLDGIERVNPKLNAFCTMTADTALAAARRAEQATTRGETLGPLHGLPYTIKDLTLTHGVRTMAGSRIFEHRVPDVDAPYARRLSDAGGVMLGKTTTPEFGWKALGDSPLTGITRNPWNPAMTSGGSSAGAGVAAACGLGALHQGSDGAGSIRIPSSFCGVYGFKPTYGRVPMWPVSNTDLTSHTGPMTRTVADAALMLAVMAGPDPWDRTSLDAAPEDYVGREFTFTVRICTNGLWMKRGAVDFFIFVEDLEGSQLPAGGLGPDSTVNLIRFILPKEEGRKLIDQLQTIPDAESVALINFLPQRQFDGAGSVIQLRDLPPPQPGHETIADPRFISPNYFETMRIPLRKGRALSMQDDIDHPPAAIINESFARKYFPDQDPIGKQFQMVVLQPFGRWFTVVGVAADSRDRGLSRDTRATFYLSYLQNQIRGGTILVRTKPGAQSTIPQVQAAVRTLNQDVSLNNPRTLEDSMDESLSPERFSATLLTLFAILALTLASVGVYGVVSYAAIQRTHEIGVRMALGAQRTDVMKLVLGHGARLAIAGVVLGVIASLAVSRLLSTLLFGVSAKDPLTIVVVSLVLTFIALLACYIPARRAMKVDPLIALRYE
jgi:hypothetical protein